MRAGLVVIERTFWTFADATVTFDDPTITFDGVLEVRQALEPVLRSS
jgi:hypothetical protein